MIEHSKFGVYERRDQLRKILVTPFCLRKERLSYEGADIMSVCRYNHVMTFLDLLSNKGLTIYSLSRKGKIPKTTLADIASGKTDLLECSGRTLLAISKALRISIEELLALEPEEPKGSLPQFLYDAIRDYRKSVRDGSTLLDCYSDQLNSSINVAAIEGLISDEQASRLRARYFGK